MPEVDKIIEDIHNENTQKLIKAVNALEKIDSCRTLAGAKKLARKVRKELGYL